MKVQFKDKHLTKEDKAGLKKALITEKEETDSVTLYAEYNYIKVKAEWIEGNKYIANVYY